MMERIPGAETVDAYGKKNTRRFIYQNGQSFTIIRPVGSISLRLGLTSRSLTCIKVADSSARKSYIWVDGNGRPVCAMRRRISILEMSRVLKTGLQSLESAPKSNRP